MELQQQPAGQPVGRSTAQQPIGMDPMTGAGGMAAEPTEEQVKAEVERQQKIKTLTLSLLERRKKAIAFRQQCGIEQEWLDCEDAYVGVDNANRDIESPVASRMQKPRDPSGGAIGEAKKPGATRSTVYLNITRPYVDAASARVSDMLLPSDDRNFTIKPTPIPELAATAGVQVPPEQLEQFRMQLQTEASKRAQAAQNRIDDWLTESRYHPELRKVIEDCARLGTGVLKGPFPFKRNEKSVGKNEFGELQIVLNEKIVPMSRRVSPWDFYPDPSCGEDVNRGAYCYERDQISARQVRELIGQPAYIEEALMECLKEGPDKSNLSVRANDARMVKDDDSYEIWYYSGEITVSDFDAVYKQQHDALEAVRVVVSVINDRIVKIAPVVLDSEDFGYDLIPWQRRPEMPWGIGVAKQISVPQRMLNAATRGMSDNAALSSGPQIVLTRGVVKPADGVFEVTARKVWFADSETSVEDIRKAFLAVDIPTRQTELMSFIQFALKMAEDVTGMPMLMQGNQGQATDTVGGMEILNANANTVLRRIAHNFDDHLTRPHIRRYYEWIMTYGDESEKGDFEIDARGSTSLVEREIQMRAILGMAALVLDPRYGLDPELWAQEALRANKIDPARLELTDDKRKAQAEAAAQQAEADQRSAAEVLALKNKQIDTGAAIAKDNNDTKVVIADKNIAARQPTAAPQLVAGNARW